MRLPFLIALLSLWATLAAATTASAAESICNEHGSCEAKERDAIAALHSQLDKDKDGVISDSESIRFLGKHLDDDRELKTKDKAFQKLDTSADDDNFVSVGELQQAWLNSRVRSWSEDDVAYWLEHKARMPQYKKLFKDNDIGGKHLPMLAMGKGRALTALGVDERHAERLATLLMLEVMFPDGTSYVKDIVLLVCLILLPVSAMGLFATKRGSNKMDQQLQTLREQLRQAEEQLNTTRELHNSKSLDSMVSAMTTEDGDGVASPTVSRNTSNARLDALATGPLPATDRERALMSEVAQLKKALTMAEGRAVPDGSDARAVRQLLRQTYQREVAYYSDKRRKAEVSLREATEEYQRVAKQQKRFMGSFRLAHGVSMDALHESVTAALEPLNETKKDYEEMVARWETIDEVLHLKLGFEKRKRK